MAALISLRNTANPVRRRDTLGSAANASPVRASACLAAFLGALLSVSGCKSNSPATTSDSALANTVQSQLASDSSIAGQPVHAAVQGGVVTISGTVDNDAQRTIAARDAAGVAGVREVINNLTVGSTPQNPAAGMMAPLPPDNGKPNPGTVAPVMIGGGRSTHAERNRPAPIERPTHANDRDPAAHPDPAPPIVAAAPPAPPPPAQPTYRNLTVSAGSTLPVRITQTLDSETTQQGATFSGTVASDIVVDGLVAIPSGSAVSGRVDAVQDAGHFSGASLLSVTLSSLNRHGDHIALATEPFTVQGKGRGRNTAEKTAGGAAVGAILGGIFGGGKGAAIGAAAGGGLGAGANAVTRGQQVQIPSESVVRFHLTSPISVRVRTDDSAATNNNVTRPDDTRQGDPVLHPR